MAEKFILHGGAGSWGDRQEEAQEEIEKIARKVKKQKSSATALETVEYAVRLMENNKIFNAGKGAKMQLDGGIRTDASIMTSKYDAGSVIGLEGGFKHPISIAKKIMDETHHVALKGTQAQKFAEKYEFEKTDLKTAVREEKLEETRKKVESLDFKQKVRKLKEMNQTGTVGAAALDQDGGLAAATSTGGVYGQLPGRVGDTPMPGCGTHCTETAAVSATGIGEAIIKTTLARRCTEYIEQGLKPSKAVDKSLNFLETKTDGEAGLIIINKDGEMAANFNSNQMVWTKVE